MARSPLDRFLKNLPPINERKRIAKNIDRKEAIHKIVKARAYKADGYYLISFWDLADGLNNHWFAPLFIKKAKYKKNIVEYHANWALRQPHLYIFKRPLNNAVKIIGGKIIQKGESVYYKIKSNSPKKPIKS